MEIRIMLLEYHLQRKMVFNNQEIHWKKYCHDLTTQTNQMIKHWIMDNRAQQADPVEAALLTRKEHL